MTLALGIGANTAAYSLMRAVVVKPLPYNDASTLVMLWQGEPGTGTTWMAVPEVQSYRQQVKAFASVDSWTTSSANLTGGGDPERLVATAVTPGLFRTLGVAPVQGSEFRTLADGDPAPAEVILSHQLWQRRFGGSDSVVGTSVIVNGTARTVVGVMPAGFALPVEFGESRPTELWTPFSFAGAGMAWGDHSYVTAARLADGATPERATAEMRVAEEGWRRDGFIHAMRTFDHAAVPMTRFVLGDARKVLAVVMGAVVLILIIACANVANLSLARADERLRDTAVRTALGASRAQLVRQMVTESLLLSGAGALVGALLASVALRALVAANPTGIPRIGDVRVDAVVLGVAALLAIVTGLVVGAWPAIAASRVNLAHAITDGGRASTVGASRMRFRDALTVVQTAGAVVLLVGAMLLVRSLDQMTRVDLGFRSDSVLTAQVALPSSSYAGTDEVVGFFDRAVARVRELPGVTAAGATRLLPLTGTIGDWSITVEGKVRDPAENPNGDWQVVTPGYFEAMGAGLMRGRFFTTDDDANAPIVAVITEAMAAKYWPGEDALGRRFHLGSSERPWITIVGIVRPVRHNEVTESARTEMYVPHAQWPVAGGAVRRAMTFVVRGSRDNASMSSALRGVIREMDPSLPVSEMQTLQAVADNALARPRLSAILVTVFAAVALAVAATGLYGVIALLVSRRRQEIGVRIALGAQTGTILTMVLRRGVQLAAIGVVTGMVGSFWVTRVLQGMLYGVTTLDPVTYAVVPLILFTIAILACLVPARRAAALDPLVALRED